MNSQVFSYEGQFLRQIGGEGVTNYPIGVGINSLGDVVVADNHNNFNLTVFSQVSLQLFYKECLLSSRLIYENEYFLQKNWFCFTDARVSVHSLVYLQDGTMIGALESKVKHAQCFDVALVDDGSVVLASKDYRLYLYRFQQGAQ